MKIETAFRAFGLVIVIVGIPHRRVPHREPALAAASVTTSLCDRVVTAVL